jgi:outer membrane biosynthesis protein TonB
LAVGPVEQPPITLSEYYNDIRKRIFEKVESNYPPQPARGEVLLSFCVLQDGSLKGIPAVLNPVAPSLRESAVKSVQDAAPFPEFPEDFGKKEETFRISIIYE